MQANVVNFSKFNQSSSIEGDAEYISVFDFVGVWIIYGILFFLVLVCCITGNVLVLIVILRSKKMRTITNFFLGNLAVADLCVGLFCIIPNLMVFLERYWYFGWLMCKLVYFIQAMCYTASVALLTVISIERYAAIIYPLKQKQITTLCLLRGVVITIWIISALLSIPILLMYETANFGAEYCLATTRINERALVVSTFIVGYTIPLILMTCMYVRIAIVLWSSSSGKGLTVTTSSSNTKCKKPVYAAVTKPTGTHAVLHVLGCPKFDDQSSTTASNESVINSSPAKATNINENTNSCLCKKIVSAATDLPQDYVNDWPSKRKADSTFAMSEVSTACNATNSTSSTRINLVVKPLNPRKNPATCNNSVLLARRRIIRLLIAVITSFAVCVLPYHATKLWLLFYGGPTNPTKEIIHATAFLFYYLNSALNPVLYAFLSQNFRRSLFEVCSVSRHRIRKPSYTGVSRSIHLTNSTL